MEVHELKTSKSDNPDEEGGADEEGEDAADPDYQPRDSGSDSSDEEVSDDDDDDGRQPRPAAAAGSAPFRKENHVKTKSHAFKEKMKALMAQRNQAAIPPTNPVPNAAPAPALALDPAPNPEPQDVNTDLNEPGGAAEPMEGVTAGGRRQSGRKRKAAVRPDIDNTYQ